MKKNKPVQLLLIVVEFILVMIIGFRQFIFPADSFIYNLYSEELAKLITARLLKTFITAVICSLIIQISNFITSLNRKSKSSTTQTAILLIGNILKYVSAIAMILSCLKIWGVDTTAIVTGASVLTLVIGLGCQTLVSDVVAGIFMIFEGDIKVGDIVVINGWRGEVRQIGLRRTSIVDSVGNINVVNNSSITNIINNTRELSYAVSDIYIEYDESLQRVENILKDNLATIKQNIPAIADGPFYKGVAELGESGVKLRFVASCTEENKFQVERDMNRQLKLLFDKYDVNIPFNQIVVTQREDKGRKSSTDAQRNKANSFVESQKELSSGIDKENK